MITFGKLFSLYFDRHMMTRRKCPDNARYFFNKHGITWASIPLNDIKRGDLQVWVDELGITSGQHGANRAINQMAAVINWGIRRGYAELTENPCRGVERFPVNSRKRFLLPEELNKFKLSLDQESGTWRDFFWMCLFTGARKGNVLRMKWTQVDTDLAIWQIPADEFKNGDDHVIPLSLPALAILAKRKGHHPVWVFPGDGERGHIVEVRRAWHRICKRAELTDIRIHDLRRTVGSYMAINNVELPTIGEALGHKDLRSTMIYARLNLAPVKAAMQGIQDRWLA